MDDLTLVLAIIGAVTGVFAAVAQGVQLWRDRPRLRLNFGFSTGIGRRPEAWIDVHNGAPHGTTVREVGFYAPAHSV